jgi:hypothetical protein
MKAVVRNLVRRFVLFAMNVVLEELRRTPVAISGIVEKTGWTKFSFERPETTIAAINVKSLQSAERGVIMVTPRFKPPNFVGKRHKYGGKGNATFWAYWNEGLSHAFETLFIEKDTNVWRSLIANSQDFENRDRIIDDICVSNPNSLVFSYHGRGGRKNAIHFKVGYFEGMWFVDTCGYSQHHSLAYTPRIPKALLPGPSDKLARIREHVIDGRISKYPQPKDRAETGGSYGLFALQTPTDTSLYGVSLEQYFEALDSAYRYCLSGGRRLAVKEHPQTRFWDRSQHDYARNYKKMLKDFISQREGSFLVEGHIHDLILSSDAVFTNNSGVGFEALLLQKPVINYVRVDYHHAAIEGRSLSDWSDGQVEKFDYEYAVRFLSLYFDFFSYVDAFPDNAIELVSFHSAVLNHAFCTQWNLYANLEASELALVSRIADAIKSPSCPVPLLL